MNSEAPLVVAIGEAGPKRTVTVQARSERMRTASPVQVAAGLRARLASPTNASSNRIVGWLRGMDALRKAIVNAA